MNLIETIIYRGAVMSYSVKLILLFFLTAAVLLLPGCSGSGRSEGAATTTRLGGSSPSESPDPAGAYPLVEGLHVTGEPVDIDIDSYRLRISGAVQQTLRLSLEQIRGMEAVRMEVRLVCPGFFVDEGYWTGVRITDLLDLAGVQPGAERLSFLSADGSYSAELSLEEVQGEGMLIAYAFEDKPLPKVHGYPLRVVALDKPGNRWVKWLGEIVVR